MATLEEQKSYLTWIIESIKRRFFWKNSSVTNQSPNEQNMPEIKGNNSFYKILFASIFLSVSIYLPNHETAITEETGQQWYFKIPRTVVSPIQYCYFKYTLWYLFIHF